MAGHSKWANTKHRKARQDNKRGKIWTKIIREITVAARVGKSADPATNPRLRLAWDKALGANMVKDTMERAAKRGVGAGDGADYVEILH
ncbi:MAG: YebC/PmpR family DNA-binding transcriptional regulator, partial [Halothiobacillus sp.]